MDVMKKLSSLQELSKIQLSKILSVNPNKKYLILEPSLIRPLERVCGVKWLKCVSEYIISKQVPITKLFQEPWRGQNL